MQRVEDLPLDLGTCAPPVRPSRERVKSSAERSALFGERVRLFLLYEPVVDQLDKPLPQHARAHSVTPRLQVPEADRPITELPQDAERPTATKEVKSDHDRPPSRGASDLPPLRFDFRKPILWR